MSNSTRLKVCELILRDGIQGWPTFIPTASKLELLHAIDAAGVPEIDLTSFVPAHVVPQFADAEAVLSGFKGAAEIRVLTVNVRGAQRVVDVHKSVRPIAVCGMPFSASEKHNIANLRCDHATHKGRIAEMVEIIGAAGVTPMVCVATAWGCPISGDIDPEIVIGHVAWLRDIGVNSIMLGDTTGAADPLRVTNLFSTLIARWPETNFIAHFHDNRGCGIANMQAAIQAGVTSIDGCIGGLGGEPAAVDQGDVGESGNVVSEDLIAMLARMGFETGIDIQRLLEAGKLAEKIIGRNLFSKVQRAGVLSY